MQLVARLNIEVTVNITLEEAYTGAEIGVVYNQSMFCDVCEGVTSTVAPCITCHGEQRMEEREIFVTIEPGISDNHIIYFHGLGNLSPDGNFRGNLILTVRVPVQSIDRVFTRVGNDLHITQVLTLKELVLGYENKTMCTHMDGQAWSTSQPFGSVINPNNILTFPDGGMPLYHSGGRGDLHVHFNYNFPQQLNILDDPFFRSILSIALGNDEERAERLNAIDTNQQNDTPPVPSTEHPEKGQRVAAVHQEHEVITSSSQQENQPDNVTPGNNVVSERSQYDEHPSSPQYPQSSTNHHLPELNGIEDADPLLPNNSLTRTYSTVLLSTPFSPTPNSSDEDHAERDEYYPESPQLRTSTIPHMNGDTVSNQVNNTLEQHHPESSQLRTSAIPHMNGDTVSNQVNNTQEQHHPESPQLRTSIIPHMNGDIVSNQVNNTQEPQVSPSLRGIFAQPQYTLQYAGSPSPPEAVLENEENQLPSYYPPSPIGRFSPSDTLNVSVNHQASPQAVIALLFGNVDQDSGNLTGENSNSTSEESTDTTEDTNDTNEDSNDTRDDSDSKTEDGNGSREETNVTREVSNETSEETSANYDASVESNDATDANNDSRDIREGANPALQGIFTSSADTTPPSATASPRPSSAQEDTVKQEDQSQGSTQSGISDLVGESSSDSLEEDLRTKRNRDRFDAEDKPVESSKRRKVRNIVKILGSFINQFCS